MEHAIAVAPGPVHARAASFPPGHSAEIVAFPSPLAPLLKATDKLQSAVRAQKAAVAVWRGSLGDAAQSMQALESSMRRYESRLAALNLDDVGARSRELAALMDKALAAQA